MEEDSGLESLIKQRQTRPSYTRMVSWEFSNQQELNPVKRKRRKSKKQSNVDEESNLSLSSADEDERDEVIGSCNLDPDVSSSDEDCLYFSAEEILSQSDSETDISQGMASLTTDGASSKDSESCKGDSVCCRPSHQEKKHAPSKKQKRKRRKQEHVFHMDEILSLIDINIEPDIMSETQELMEDSLAFVEKSVPSLVELCLNCTCQRNLNIQLPKGLKNMVKPSYKDFSFRKFQVSWLQNEFSRWQPLQNREAELFLCKYLDPDPWESECVFKCPVPSRNIWNSEFFPKLIESSYGSEYNYSKTSSILPFTFATQPGAYNFNGLSYVFYLRFLGSLATLVDLMMPAVLTSRNIETGREPKSESEQISSATKTALNRVKGALKVRFADVTDTFFDKMIPYVFWARGDQQQATTLFTKLIDGDKRSRYRAMCMVEVARMHAQLGEPELACRFYRMAADIALEKGKKITDSKEVTGQMLMLLASVYDQGMMTHHKACAAADRWKYVVTAKGFNQGAANMAAISMLCFHSRPSSGTDKHSSFEEALTRLKAMSDVCPQYQYYISMLQAFAGQGSDADNTYREYLQRANMNDDTADTPGLRLLSSSQTSGAGRRQRQNIWFALETMVTKSAPPQPLQVLWRSHLQPLRVCDPTSLIPPTEADLCCDNLDLRLNSEGYLTGNMKLLLPPMRSINLNPYTGKLCFPHTPGRTEPWTSLDRFYLTETKHCVYENGHIPCPVEVYRNDNGTTVQMMLPMCMIKSERYIDKTRSNKDAITFFWSDNKGQTARLSVLKIFQQMVYERMKQRVLKDAILRKKSEQWQKDCLKIAKVLHDNRRGLCLYSLDGMVHNLEEKRKESPKTRLTPKMIMEMANERSPCITWHPNYTSYGQTVALSFIYDSEYITMYLDCSSREAFLQSKIKLQPYLVSEFGSIPNVRNNKLAGGEIFYYCGQTSEYGDTLIVRGQKGKLLDKIKIDDAEQTRPCVIGRHLVMVNYQSRLWCWNDKIIKVNETLPPFQSLTSLECSVVMVTLRDRKSLRFVNIPSMDSVSVRDSCDRKGLQITEDGLEIKSSTVKVLNICSRTEDGQSYQQVILGMDTNLVTLHIPLDNARSMEVVITDVLPICGFPVEHKFVGKQDGYLLSWTQQEDSAKEYKEHLSYFSNNSELLGVLPCLGKGPRSFCPLYLTGDTDTQTDNPGYGLPGWYVYMRDGHDGIIAVKLPKSYKTK